MKRCSSSPFQTTPFRATIPLQFGICATRRASPNWGLPRLAPPNKATSTIFPNTGRVLQSQLLLIVIFRCLNSQTRREYKLELDHLACNSLEIVKGWQVDIGTGCQCGIICPLTNYCYGLCPPRSGSTKSVVKASEGLTPTDRPGT